MIFGFGRLFPTSNWVKINNLIIKCIPSLGFSFLIQVYRLLYTLKHEKMYFKYQLIVGYGKYTPRSCPENFTPGGHP